MRTRCGEEARVCCGRRLMRILRSSGGGSRGCGMAFGSLLLGTLLLQVLEGVSARGNVTLQSIELATTHEWFSLKPNVYFACQGEPKVYLPDVTEKNKPYNFSGLESFQPLTSLDGQKCKRCGFYEHDTIKSDDVFHEWELCPSGFSSAPENRYTLSVEKELNITLICEGCHPQVLAATEPPPASVEMAEEEDHHGSGLKIVVTVFVGIIIVSMLYVGYLIYRKKQREQQQKRFIQLFEDDEDFDEELGLKDDL